MNTVKIEKLLKKELKKLDKDLFDRVDDVRVFAQSKSAKKAQYCIIFSLKKEKSPDLNYFVRQRDDEVKALKGIYFDVLGQFVEEYSTKKSEEKEEKSNDKVQSVLKKRWKKLKKAIA